MSDTRTGVYVCHCGTNIAATVDVEDTAKFAATLPGVAVARHDRFMCSQPGQERIRKDIEKLRLNRVVVAACSPQMHELTFRAACEQAGLNGHLCQVANIREQCSWVHGDRVAATAKARALVAAAVRRVAHHQPLATTFAPLNPATLIVGAGIAGIQAALEIAQTGHEVWLVERESTVGGKMATFDKTFPTLDCAACILTPKMVALTRHRNIHVLSLTEVERVAGSYGDFTVTLRRRARYVLDTCTACGACAKVCPVSVPSPFDQLLGQRTAVHRAFAQAIPATYVIEKQQRPPCLAACPLGLPAGGVAALARRGKFRDAARLLRLGNPLAHVCARVCHRPCEDGCNRARVEDAVNVGALERFVLDWAREHKVACKPPSVRPRGVRVAVAGSGAAGLTCAAELARLGYQVAVFEKAAVLGGQLAQGIPAFRLPRAALEDDLAWLRALGVTFHTGVAFDPTAVPPQALAANGGTRVAGSVTAESLAADGFAALFLATGFNRPRPLGVPGDALPGVISGLEFLRGVNLGGDGHLAGRRVVVVGGDDVAVDAARAARRCGATVTLVCAPNKVEMPADRADLAAAQAEGVTLRCRSEVVAVVGREAVTGVQVMDVVAPTAEAAAGSAEGASRLLLCDAVIAAVGEVPEPGLEPPADPETRQTAVPWIFAANLAAAGPTAVANAMAVGRRAAEAIDRYLTGRPLADFTTRLASTVPPTADPRRPHSYAPAYDATPHVARLGPTERPPQDRVRDWDDATASGLTEAQAIAEAGRCLACGVCVECGECERVCDVGAVQHAMADELVDVRVGQVLLTTGYRLFDARRMPEYGYGRLPDVVTGLEFERLLNSAGPTGGKVVCRDGRTPRAIAIVHCVGSRHHEFHKYCSRVCCMYALKFAHLVRDRTAAQVYQLYIDMRADGKGFEEFYGRVMEEGSTVIRGRVAEVAAARGAAARSGALVVKTEDTLLGTVRELPVDMVILCSAIEPQADADRIKKLFSISMSPDGFFLERHPKLDPTSTFTDGVFIAGTCQGPKDIPDTVAQASAAAARMMGNIARGQVAIDPVRAAVDEARCSGCRLCNGLCPYHAIEFVAERRVSRVTTALCKGCGTCVAACPSGAMAGAGFTDEQILAEIEGLFAA